MQGGPGQNTGGGWTWPAPPREPQCLCTQWAAADHVGAPPPCPCTADPPRRVDVGGQWSGQSLQLTGLGKSLQLTCQQKSRLNYKRRVYPAHKASLYSKQIGGLPEVGVRGWVKWVKVQKVQTSNYKISQGDVMYRMVSIGNNIVLHI